jgi:hypothetical protein
MSEANGDVASMFEPNYFEPDLIEDLQVRNRFEYMGATTSQYYIKLEYGKSKP